MTVLSSLAQVGSVAIPAVVGAGLLRRHSERRHSETLHVAASVAALLLVVAGYALGWGHGPGAAVIQTAPIQTALSESFGSSMGMLVAVIALCLAVGIERDLADPRARGLLLLTEAALLLLYTSPSPAGMAAGCVLSALPLAYDLGRTSPPPERARTLGTLAILLVGSGALAGFVLTRSEGLMAIGLVLRTALVPCFGWLLYATTRGNLALGTLLLVSQPALFIELGVGEGSMPGPDWEGIRTGLVGLALSTGLAGSVLGSRAPGLRRQLGCLGLTMGGILLAASVSESELLVLASSVAWISFALGITGLALLTSAIESRMTHAETGRLGHVARDAPWLGGFGIALSLALVGLPGTLGFIASELMIDGWIEIRPWAATLVGVTMALTAVNLMRMFWGMLPSTGSERLPLDLTRRERAALWLVLLPLLLFGVLPKPLLAEVRATPERTRAPAGGTALQRALSLQHGETPPVLEHGIELVLPPGLEVAPLQRGE